MSAVSTRSLRTPSSTTNDDSLPHSAAEPQLHPTDCLTPRRKDLKVFLCVLAALRKTVSGLPHGLLSDAESREDAVEDVVRGGRPGDARERCERLVEIDEQHLVRDAPGGCAARLIEAGHGLAQTLLVADAGDESGLRHQPFLGSDLVHDLPAQLRDPLPRQCGDRQQVFAGASARLGRSHLLPTRITLPCRVASRKSSRSSAWAGSERSTTTSVRSASAMAW